VGRCLIRTPVRSSSLNHLRFFPGVFQHHLLEPIPTKENRSNDSSSSSTSPSDETQQYAPHHQSLIQTAFQLFSRVPVLASLCIEVLTCQCVSSIINFLFFLKLKEYIPDDQQRARWTGSVSAYKCEIDMRPIVAIDRLSHCNPHPNNHAKFILLWNVVLRVDQCLEWNTAIRGTALFGKET
jgi:hypothetical protein